MLSRRQLQALLARVFPAESPSASRIRPEVSLLPNLGQILICLVDTRAEPFLQDRDLRREPSPFITHLVVDHLATIRLREIDRPLLFGVAPQ